MYNMIYIKYDIYIYIYVFHIYIIIYIYIHICLACWLQFLSTPTTYSNNTTPLPKARRSTWRTEVNACCVRVLIHCEKLQNSFFSLMVSWHNIYIYLYIDLYIHTYNIHIYNIKYSY